MLQLDCVEGEVEPCANCRSISVREARTEAVGLYAYVFITRLQTCHLKKSQVILGNTCPEGTNMNQPEKETE